jgi:hypothetical protein
VIKSRRIKGVTCGTWHVWGRVGIKMDTWIWWGNLTKRGHLKDLGEDERMISKKWDGWRWLDSLDLGQGQVAGCFEHGNVGTVSIKWGKFLD